MSKPREDASYRQALRSGNRPEEVLSWKPWCDDIAKIKSLLLIQPPPELDQVPTTASSSSAGQSGATASAGERPTRDADDEIAALYVTRYAESLKNKMTSYVEEPKTQTGIRDVVSNHRLGSVKHCPADANSGNVMSLMDCNVWGEADSRPRNRVVAVNAKVFQHQQRGLLLARTGEAEPQSLPLGDVHIIINAGKTRGTLL